MENEKGCLFFIYVWSVNFVETIVEYELKYILVDFTIKDVVVIYVLISFPYL